MIVRPFRAVRPKEAEAASVAALPYDVFDEAEARKETLAHPHSFLNIDRPETQFPEGYDMYAPEVYEKAAELLKMWLLKGILIRDEEPAYYLYSLTMNGRRQRGIVGCSLVDDYVENRIRKHENTRKEKEEDRVRHIDVTSMQTGPIFLAYRQNEEMRQLVSEMSGIPPVYDFVSEDGVRHEVRKIGNTEDIRRIREAFEHIPRTYIADGHHRAASAVRVCLKRRETHPDADGSEEFNSFLSVLFADEELSIMDYNRIVRIPEGKTDGEILEKIGNAFEITKEGPAGTFEKPTKKGTCGMYLDGQWFTLKAKPKIRSDDPVEGLDVRILQKYVLDPVFYIRDPKSDPNIDFVGGIRGLQELERRCDEGRMAAFSMVPTSMDELFSVADEGRLMPPKSTWFEPKLRSGLLIHEIEK